MKEATNCTIEKPFSCDVDGCYMKFTNEDHLMVHKKRHDMVLNLGLAPKGSTFSDQTPTPTRFIRNCEEVGLFQDLQNVNPFEETFRKAVEAVKAGQTPLSDRAFQSNPSDDTLHTPNVFPHITDLQCVNQNENLIENKEPQNDIVKDDMKVINTHEKELSSKPDIEPQKLILKSVSHKKRKSEFPDKPLIVEKENHDNSQLVNAKKEDNSHETVALNENENCQTNIHISLEEKTKCNAHGRPVPTLIQLKIPIPKSNCSNRYQKSTKDKFSTFSKNSLKFETNLEKPQSGIFDLSKKRRARKSYTGLPKDRIEILERNRAAATRCREKKKIYISYLEKLSRELTESNKKLRLHNAHLRKEISLLQAELLRHQNCSLSNPKEIAVPESENGKESENNLQKSPDESSNINIDHNQNIGKTEENIEKSNLFKCEDELETVFKTVKGSLSDNSIDNISKNSPSLNNSINSMSFVDNLTYPTHIFFQEDKLRKIYTDHSYSNCLSPPETKKISNIPNIGKSTGLSKDIKKMYKRKVKVDSSDIIVSQDINPPFKSVTAEPLILIPQAAFILKPLSNNITICKQPESSATEPELNMVPQQSFLLNPLGSRQPLTSGDMT